MAKITWFGHAAFQIDIAGRIVLVDPYLDRNPESPIKSDKIAKADVVFVTHDHADHLGEAFKICSKTNAVFVAVTELADYAEKSGVKDVISLNVDGTVEVAGVKLTIVRAVHTALRGMPTGVVIEGENKAIYHAGDTGLFGDMRYIGEFHNLDVALLPVGGYYTMGAREAAEAVRLLNPKVVIPMHFKTFSVLASSADEFVKLVKDKMPKTKTVVLKPGESYEV